MERDDAVQQLMQQSKTQEAAEAALAAGKIVTGRVAKITAAEEGKPPAMVCRTSSTQMLFYQRTAACA